MAFLFQEDTTQIKERENKLPRGSKVTTNKPSTLYTFYDSTKHQGKKVCLP